jgi:predicted CopG family antitoxin
MTVVAKQIKVQDDTYDELTNLGGKKETYDDIIKKCIAAYKKSVSKK